MFPEMFFLNVHTADFSVAISTADFIFCEAGIRAPPHGTEMLSIIHSEKSAPFSHQNPQRQIVQILLRN